MARNLSIPNKSKMEQLIKKYFKQCDRKHQPYTMSGLAASLGIDRTSLCNYANREEFFESIKNAKAKIQQQMEENMLTGASKSTPSIFSLKNNYDWRDTVQVESTVKVDLKNLSELSTRDLLRLLPPGVLDEIPEIQSVMKEIEELEYVVLDTGGE